MNHNSTRAARPAPRLLLALALAACLLLPLVVPLTAQDDARPTPDAPAAQIFLPLAAAGPAPAPVMGEVIPGQYIVVLADPATRAANSPSGEADPPAVVAAQVVNAFGGEVLYTYESALSGFAAVLPEEAVAELAQSEDVAFIEPDTVVTTQATQPNAPWGLDRIDQRDRPLSGSYVYNVTGADVHAYIIDTGVRSTHQEFAGRLGNGYTAISDGNGTGDCNGHGTHVAGTVGGVTYGVAKGVTLHAVRVLGCNGSGSNAGVIAGVDWVRANHTKPAVANMSLGGSASTALDTAVRNAIAAGVTFALAAGNENVDACNSSPARTAEALTVGATTNGDVRSSFSNYGACLDLFAPGSSITSAYNSGDGATASLSGTSMASPHVAGAAALYLAAFPNAAPAQVADALIANASLSKVSSSGTGSPNRLLYTGFIGGAGPAPTNTPAPTATATATRTPTPTNTPITPPPPTATATRTPVTSPTATPVGTATPAPGACTNQLANGGFEQGRTVWAESSALGYTLICTATSCGASIPPHVGSYLSWLGGANSETSEVRQTLTLPAGKAAYLAFQYQVLSNDYCGYDYGYVQVIDNGVTRTLKRYNLCTTAKTTAWTGAQFDLSAYAGRAITVVFRTKTDASYSSSFFVDSAALTQASVCAAGVNGVEAWESGEVVEEAASAEVKPATPAGAEASER